MDLFLRIAAVLALLRAAGLIFFKPVVLGSAMQSAVVVTVTNGLAMVNLGLAFLFWRIAADPGSERSALYTAIVLTGMRAAMATYEVLYVLEGDAATVALIDMVACLGLFVGMVNTLPGTLHVEED